MLSGIRKFSDNQSGSMAVLATLLVLPLIGMMACIYEYSEFTKIRGSIQESADNAVLAAFHNPNEKWDKRASRTNDIFEANLTHKSKMKFARAKLKHKLVGGKTILTYKVRTGIKTIFGAFLPNMPEEFTVSSSASFDPKSQRGPKLVRIDYTRSGSSSGGKQRTRKKHKPLRSEYTEND